MRYECVYIAGALTPRGLHDENPALDYMCNLHLMIKTQEMLARKGYSPFPTGLDFNYPLVCGAGLKEEDLKRIGMDWLKRADCVVLLEGWGRSPGTLEEIRVAEKMGIPVFKSVKEFLDE